MSSFNIPQYIPRIITQQVIPAFTHAGSHGLTQLGGIASGIACAEMGIRAVGNIFKEITGNGTEKNRENLSKNLGGAVFYAGLGLNIIPGSAFLGGAILTGYTINHSTREFKDSYLFSYLTGGLVYRAINNIVWPIACRVWDCVGDIIKNLGMALGRVINAVIPHDPIWIGVCSLSTAIILYKGPIVLAGLVYKAVKGVP